MIFRTVGKVVSLALGVSPDLVLMGAPNSQKLPPWHEDESVEIVRQSRQPSTTDHYLPLSLFTVALMIHVYRAAIWLALPVDIELDRRELDPSCYLWNPLALALDGCERLIG